MSSYLQEMVCHVGQSAVFEDGEKMLRKTRNIEVGAKQIERVSHYYGEKVENTLLEKIQKGEDAQYLPDEKTELHYVGMDGSMILTREEKWKEMKLGRIFKAKDNVLLHTHRHQIMQSTYVAHLGGEKDFLEKMAYYTYGLSQVVFIADGARWIWKWIETHHPDALQILDFYHAIEHLSQFAHEYFKNDQKRKRWVKWQKGLLLKDQVDKVIQHISVLVPPNEQVKEKQQQLIGYYQQNKKRMHYGTYLRQGYMIGSGPIESANKQIVQQRLKLSGQRWTKVGAQKIVALRTACYSNQWDAVVEFTKKAA